MTVLKAFFIALLLYLIYRTGRNMVRAALDDPKAPPRRRENRRRPRSNEPPHRHRAPHEEIEDAEWEDLS